MLVSKDGNVKCTDFGISRPFGKPTEMMTKAVCTRYEIPWWRYRWYKAPEIIYGDPHYGPEIDMWSVGCIFAEMLMRKPLFPGESDIDQLSKITSILGCPNVIQSTHILQLGKELARSYKLAKLYNVRRGEIGSIEKINNVTWNCWWESIWFTKYDATTGSEEEMYGETSVESRVLLDNDEKLLKMQ